jgi:plastocyanin
MLSKNAMWRVCLGVMAAAMIFASVASAHAPQTITIRHQMRGCHMWSFTNGPYKASLKIKVDRDATLRFVNDDVMPHKLVQLAGPRSAIAKANMNRIGAVAVLMFPGKGVYKFTTRPGEDYKGMAMKTIGKDNVLRLTVVVK